MNKMITAVIVLIFLTGCASSKAMKKQSEEIMPLITEEMMNTARSFYFQTEDGEKKPNIIEGPKESASSESRGMDYAVDFAWRWNEKHGHLGTALVIIFTGWTAMDLPRSPWTGTFFLLEKITDPSKKADMGNYIVWNFPENPLFYLFRNTQGEQFIALRPTEDELIYYHPKYPKPDAYKKQNEEVMDHMWVAILGPEGSNWGVSLDPMRLDMTGSINDNLRFFTITDNEMKVISNMRSAFIKSYQQQGLTSSP